MVNPDAFPSRELAAKVAELQQTADTIVIARSGTHLTPLRDTLSDLLDAMEISYEEGCELPIPFVDEETRRYQHLTGELADLVMRKEETRQAISEGYAGRGAHYYLKGLYRQIREVKTELEPIARPTLFPLTGTEDNT